MGSIAVHRLQHQLNILDKDIFHHLRDDGIPIAEEIVEEEEENLPTAEEGTSNSRQKMNKKQDHEAPASASISGEVIEATTMCTIGLRPSKTIDT